MKNKKSVYELILTSIIGAVILMLSIIPNVGFIQILPGVAVTIIHIPVIIGVFLLSLRSSIILGFLFGLGSFIVALSRPTTPFDMAFQNPLISILPRMLFAVSAFYIAKGFKSLAKLNIGKYLMFGIISIVTAIGLFFGVKQITNQFAYSKYNDNNNTIAYLSGLVMVLEDNEGVIELIESNISNKKLEKEIMTKYNVSIYVAKEIISLDLKSLTQNQIDEKIIEVTNQKIEKEALIDDLLNNANETYSKSRKISVPVSIIVIVLLIGLNYYFTLYKYTDKTFISSVFILSTLIHTVLVLTSVVVFNPQSFKDTFGNQNILILIYMIAAFNGIIEAFVGALIGTPVATAVTLRQERE